MNEDDIHYYITIILCMYLLANSLALFAAIIMLLLELCSNIVWILTCTSTRTHIDSARSMIVWLLIFYHHLMETHTMYVIARIVVVLQNMFSCSKDFQYFKRNGYSLLQYSARSLSPKLLH